MENSLATLPLLERLSEGGFRASVIATYNCFFPFYEEVILRRLVAAGCTHNIVLLDAARCAEAFARDDLRPRLAGSAYTLIPVRVGGVFHPKMLLRFGKTKGELLVGSHNLTLAGFGLNDELTNSFRADGQGLRSGARPLREAFEYLSSFVPGVLPDVADAWEGLRTGIPWLEGPMAVGDSSRFFMGCSGSGDALWERVRPFVPSDVRRALVVGPFFDKGLEFVQRMVADVRPRELVIGIDPETVQLDSSRASTLTSARFVNVAGVAQVPERREDSKPFLHAKALWFEGADGELLVTGSANPSGPAFLPVSARNAEGIVVDRRPGRAESIGLRNFVDAPVVTPAEWETLSNRTEDTKVEGADANASVLLCTPTPDGFLVAGRLSENATVVVLDPNGLRVGDGRVSRTADASHVEVANETRDLAHRLEVRWAERTVFVLVHRSEDIGRNLGSDTRKALRQALGALEDGSGHLDTFLKLAEKVICDSDDIVRVSGLRVSSARTSDAPPPSHAGGSLALDAGGRKESRRRRSLASGDIVVLIDALMRRLGEGLPGPSAARPKQEEEQIGADDEDGAEPAPTQPLATLAKVCRGKVRRLLRRLEGQIELAAESGRARRAVVQIAAVLGVLRALRIVEQRPEWRRAWETLVERDDERAFLSAAAVAIGYGPESLARRALVETDGEWFDELSMAVGLLAWLKWETEAEHDADGADEEGDTESAWLEMQRFALLAPFITREAYGHEILLESVEKTPRRGVDGQAWVARHLDLAETFALVELEPGASGLLGRTPRPGDLVVLAERFVPRVRVVLAVEHVVGGDAKVKVFDANEEDGARTFLASKVTSLEWCGGQAKVARTG